MRSAPAIEKPSTIFSESRHRHGLHRRDTLLDGNRIEFSDTPTLVAPQGRNRIRRTIARVKEIITLDQLDKNPGVNRITRVNTPLDAAKAIIAKDQSPDLPLAWYGHTYRGNRQLDGIFGIGYHDSRDLASLQMTTETLTDHLSPQLTNEIRDLALNQNMEEFDLLFGAEVIQNIRNLTGLADNWVQNIELRRLLTDSIAIFALTHPEHRWWVEDRIHNRVLIYNRADDGNQLNKNDARELSMEDTVTVFVDRFMHSNRSREYERRESNVLERAWYRLREFIPGMSVKSARINRMRELKENINRPVNPEPVYNSLVAKLAAEERARQETEDLLENTDAAPQAKQEASLQSKIEEQRAVLLELKKDLNARAELQTLEAEALPDYLLEIFNRLYPNSDIADVNYHTDRISGEIKILEDTLRIEKGELTDPVIILDLYKSGIGILVPNGETTRVISIDYDRGQKNGGFTSLNFLNYLRFGENIPTIERGIAEKFYTRLGISRDDIQLPYSLIVVYDGKNSPSGIHYENRNQKKKITKA